ncbi:unnamed protein product [Mytilus coruscus]|uniref:Ig-like domain-containing protein n=1 Tax=Mytilus coruscus TaxID=42192 RepID=A0A6J8BS08_MYTCO|nr:unnamed protein product [Mytilus coruscus]
MKNAICILMMQFLWGQGYGRVLSISYNAESNIGNSLLLTCTVYGIEKVDPEVTRQFAKGSDGDLLSFNGQITKKEKYAEQLSTGNKFSLLITNVTKSDINCIYQCRYGFDYVKKFIEINETKYGYNSTKDTTLIEFKKRDHDSFENELNLTTIVPVPSCAEFMNSLNLKFKNTSVVQKGIFYKTSFYLRHSYVEGQCKDTNLRICCKIGTTNYIITTVKSFLECSDSFFQWFLVTAVVILILVVAALIYIIHNKKHKSSEKVEMSEDCTLLNRRQNGGPSLCLSEDH